MSEARATVASPDALLLTKLAELDRQHAELTSQLEDPAIAANGFRLVQINKQLAQLARLVTPYRQLRSYERQIDDAKAMAEAAGSDRDLRDLAQAEVDDLVQKRDALLDRIKTELVSSEEAAVGAVILEIRAGVGGEEAALFARDLQEVYSRFAAKHGWRVETIDISAADAGGLKEVILGIKGDAVYAALAFESGVHRVQRVPATEAQGRIHTSTATVAVLPEVEESDVHINWESDVEEFVSRAGGPGGQNVNKVESAVRLRHIETGIEVNMRDEKSQHKNREKARRLLLARVAEHQLAKQRAERASTRKSMVGSGNRSEKIRTYNFPQDRCTDHRIGVTVNNLPSILAGNLDPLVEALQTHEKQERLANLDAWM